MNRAGAAVVCVIAVLASLTPASWASAADRPEPAVFERSWFYRGDDDAQFARLQEMVGERAPEIEARNWRGEGFSLEEARGDIVVIDFWATWCGPCRAAMPKLERLQREHADDGLRVVALCNGVRGGERMHQVAESLRMTIPTGLDTGNRMFRAYGGQWWPFYVLVDREGVVRARGLHPDGLVEAVRALLREQPKPEESEGAGVVAAPSARFVEGGADRAAELAGVIGVAAPALPAEGWLNAEDVGVEEHLGKVVLVEFWGTDCRRSVANVRRLNALAERFADRGLVVIGVCGAEGHGDMGSFVERHGVAYPVVADADGSAAAAYRANDTPDSYLIDRTGVVRYADVEQRYLIRAMTELLREPAPDDGEPGTGRG